MPYTPRPGTAPIPNKPGKSNWVEREGNLPSYIRRIAEHLKGQGKSTGHAIAIAVNAAKRMCASGDTNFPGAQQVNAKSRAEACKAVAQWEKMKASAKAKRALNASGGMDYDELDLDMMDDEDLALVASVIDDESKEDIMSPVLPDGLYEEEIDDAVEIANALTAGAAPLNPPSDWFESPGLSKPTPLSVTEDGRVFGHIAAWDVNHIGLPGGTKPPRSRSDYAFFKTGLVRTEDGADTPVGQLTLAGGHAPISADAGSAVQHYDDTASAFADVNVGEDAYGIWISGAVRPGVTEEQIRAIRASAPSGDWRPINGNLELVACCQVNVPGFPIARSMVAGGEMLSLVAAGASPLYALRQEQIAMDSLQEVADRVTRLEDELTESLVAAGKKPAFLKDKDEDEDTDGEDTDDTESQDEDEEKPDGNESNKDKMARLRAIRDKKGKMDKKKPVTASSMTPIERLRMRTEIIRRESLNKRMNAHREN
jgi:hypothetical protein